MKYRRYIRVMVALLIALTVWVPIPSQMQGQDVEEEGSEESVKEGPWLIDTETNLVVQVFESVLNRQRLNDSKFSRMRFFVAPLLHMVPFSNTAAYQRIEIPDLGIVRYTFKFRNSDPDLDAEILRFINRYYSEISGQEQPITAEQITLLGHGPLTIRPRLPEAFTSVIVPATIPNDPNVPVNTRVILKPFETFSLDVPLSKEAAFRQLADTGLEFDFRVFFNVKDISLLNLSFSAEELLNTRRYKNIQQSGAAFVNAEQTQEMIREAISKRNASIVIDPGIDARLQAYAFKLFDGFVEDAKTVALNSAKDAAAIDSDLATGMGLDPNEFKPITLMWDVHEIIKNAESRNAANAQLNQWYNNNREEVEKIRERFKEQEIQVSMDGKYSAGPLSLGRDASYRELNRSFDRDETQNLSEEMDKGFIQSEDSFKEEQQKYREATGSEVEIVARGLSLVERASFENKVKSGTNINIALPTNKAASFNVADGVPTEVQEYPDELRSLLNKVTQLESTVQAHQDNYTDPPKLDRGIRW